MSEDAKRLPPIVIEITQETVDKVEEKERLKKSS